MSKKWPLTAKEVITLLKTLPKDRQISLQIHITWPEPVVDSTLSDAAKVTVKELRSLSVGDRLRVTNPGTSIPQLAKHAGVAVTYHKVKDGFQVIRIA